MRNAWHRGDVNQFRVSRGSIYCLGCGPVLDAVGFDDGDEAQPLTTAACLHHDRG